MYESKAREVIQNIRRLPGRACRKGCVGRVQIPRMDGIVLQTLKECSGTCNILKALRTGKAPPNLIQTLHLPSKSVLHAASIHIHSQIK